jgi:hypothetical protein
LVSVKKLALRWRDWFARDETWLIPPLLYTDKAKCSLTKYEYPQTLSSSGYRTVQYFQPSSANDFDVFRNNENVLVGKYVNLTFVRVIKENEMVVACGSWEREGVHRGVCWGDLRGRPTWKT